MKQSIIYQLMLSSCQIERRRTMSNIIVKQFEQVRGWTIEVAGSVTEDIVLITPKGFHNNILWQIGHILSSTEYFLFDLSHQTNHLPPEYISLFGSGTNPNQWEGNIPVVEQLITDLRVQSDHFSDISDSQFNQRLPATMHGFQTVEDCAAFSVLHEALHIGKIEEMQRMLTHLE